MPKVRQDELQEILDDSDEITKVDLKRKVREERKEIRKRKMKYFSSRISDQIEE